jgi:hypothetical protein
MLVELKNMKIQDIGYRKSRQVSRGGYRTLRIITLLRDKRGSRALPWAAYPFAR